MPVYKPARKVPEFLEKHELAQIFEYAEWNVQFSKAKGLKRDTDAAYMRRAAVRFLYTTALRNFEFRAVTLTDINLNGLYGNIVGKGAKLRAFTFNEATREKVTEYLQVRAKLFPKRTCRYLFFSGINDKGKGLSEYGLNAILKKLAIRAGITKNVHAHMFRHSLATHLLEDGWSIIAVRDKLGHENVSTTSIYSHTTPKTLIEMTRGIGHDLVKSG